MTRLWILLCGLLCGPLQAATPTQADAEPTALTFNSDQLAQPQLGDLDAMLARRSIRVLTTYNKTGYFIDKGIQRGVTYDAFMLLEKRLNEQLRKQKNLKRHLKLHLIFIPVAREALLDALIAGKGDIAAANLTITDKRKEQGVAFTAPLLDNVRELLISGPRGTGGRRSGGDGQRRPAPFHRHGRAQGSLLAEDLSRHPDP